MFYTIILSGHTASYKTSLSIELARELGAEIINFDSICFYRELSIASSKPSMIERGNIPHHLIDIESIVSPINAADFVLLANAVGERLHHQNKPVILVGGSGFYLRALLHGMYPSQKPSALIIEKIESLIANNGPDALLKYLQQVDPGALKYIHSSDHFRLRRAVEHYLTTQTLWSQTKDNFVPQENFWKNKLLHINLNIPKAEHVEIITKRIMQQLHDGMIEEVEGLLKSGYPANLRPLQSVGIKEVIQYIKGEISSKDELVQKIIIATRKLAKAQRTWFKKDDSRTEFNPVHQRREIKLCVHQFIGN